MDYIMLDRMFFIETFAVGCGGAFGSVCRFFLSRWLQSLPERVTFPFGIMVVNILGCFCIGVLTGLLLSRYNLNTIWRAGLIIGVLGGFTTFSSFSMDTWTLLLSGEYFSAFSYVILTLTICLI